VKPERFLLALERLPSEDWAKFEHLASTFLAVEYGALRTVASQSGDRGRDAYLFVPEDDPAVKLQYSVAADWRAKILATAKTLNEHFPETKILVYVTNQPIGASGDALRDEVRKTYKLFLNVLDRSWFVERVNSSAEREVAAEDLAREVVDPLLRERGLSGAQPAALDSLEQQAAFVYLGLQFEDDSREKGLTKVAFEALVRAALRETDSERRMTRADVQEAVRKMLTGARSEEVDPLTDAALRRLTKSQIRTGGGRTSSASRTRS